ncbi:UNVERIFIED_CONTAM: hypothetical protein K2H54_025199 [Gekko kuhli]
MQFFRKTHARTHTLKAGITACDSHYHTTFNHSAPLCILKCFISSKGNPNLEKQKKGTVHNSPLFANNGGQGLANSINSYLVEQKKSQLQQTIAFIVGTHIHHLTLAKLLFP